MQNFPVLRLSINGIDISISMASVNGNFSNNDANRPVRTDQTRHGQNRSDEIDRAFLAGLGDLIAKGTDCSIYKGHANYAPKAIKVLTLAGQAFELDELDAAMKRLLRAGDIRSVKEGPPSRQRSRLIMEEPNLPSL